MRNPIYPVFPTAPSENRILAPHFTLLVSICNQSGREKNRVAEAPTR